MGSRSHDLMFMVFSVFDTSLVGTGLKTVSGVVENEGGWLGCNGVWSSSVQIVRIVGKVVN